MATRGSKKSFICQSEVVVQEMRQLLGENLNVTILVDGQELMTNQILISIFSKQISAMISTRTEDNIILPIKGYDFEDIQNVIQLIHTGVVSIDNSKIEKFQQCLHKLQVIGFLEYDDIRNNQTQTDQSENPPSPPIKKIILLPKGDGSGRVVCAPCNKEFAKMFNAQRHVKTFHESDSGKKIPCITADCEKTFSNKLYLDTHLRKEHNITQKMLKAMTEPKKTKIKQEKNPNKAAKTLKVPKRPQIKKIKKEVVANQPIDSEDMGNMDTFDQPSDAISNLANSPQDNNVEN